MTFIPTFSEEAVNKPISKANGNISKENVEREVDGEILGTSHNLEK